MGSPVSREDRVGKTNRAKNGLMMTIIEYRGWDDLDIQFEDGIIVYHQAYANFMKGTIRHPTNRAKNKPDTRHIGETNKARNGMEITIIAYRNAKDLDIMFEDGAIAEHQNYRMFKEGKIRHPDPSKRAVKKPNIKIGEKNKSSCGMEIEVIAIQDYAHIDVRFENGLEVKGVSYERFKSGCIAPPGYQSAKHYLDCTKRLGEQNRNNQGLLMTIIDYKGSQKVTIQFEDGAIVKNQSYQSFRKGQIRHPNYVSEYIKHIGETIKNSQGLNMTIIDVKHARDITVRFDDGTEVPNRNYIDFLRGGIRNPNYSEYLGCETVSNEGIQMKIVGYNNYRDITIKYETGYVAEHKNKDYFLQGMAKHPFPYTIGNIVMDKPAYVLGNVGNFYCHCKECGNKDILTISEIKNHLCNKSLSLVVA